MSRGRLHTQTGDRVDDESAERDVDQTEVDEAEETPSEGVETTQAVEEESTVRRGISATSWVALAVAVLFGISGAVAWWSTHESDDLALAKERDAVRIAATRDIAVLNTLDYRSIARGLKSWQSVSTGTLRDQFAGVTAKDQQLLADQKKISTGKVVEAAVLDVDPDSATVLASVEVTVRDGSDASAEPVVKRNRFSADMTRSGGQWKISSLQQVAVDVS